MATSRRYTSADLDALPDIEGLRYEIVDGELLVSKQPHWHHQYAADEISRALGNWSEENQLGIPISVPGLIFSPENDVIPDVVWISWVRLRQVEDRAGHLSGAPELAIEILSAGAANERRDRQVKLGLYSRQGVQEYWIVSWFGREVLVYRRSETGLVLVATLRDGDELTSPLLAGFSLPVSRLWSYPA
jgi:Uma2 family endonuclease